MDVGRQRTDDGEQDVLIGWGPACAAAEFAIGSDENSLQSTRSNADRSHMDHDRNGTLAELVVHACGDNQNAAPNSFQYRNTPAGTPRRNTPSASR